MTTDGKSSVSDLSMPILVGGEAIETARESRAEHARASSVKGTREWEGRRVARRRKIGARGKESAAADRGWSAVRPALQNERPCSDREVSHGSDDEQRDH